MIAIDEMDGHYGALGGDHVILREISMVNHEVNSQSMTLSMRFSTYDLSLYDSVSVHDYGKDEH